MRNRKKYIGAHVYTAPDTVPDAQKYPAGAVAVTDGIILRLLTGN